MSPSIWQLLLVVIVVFVIFGAGKLPKVMGDLGKGVRNLKDGLKGDDEETKELASEKIEEKKGEKKVTFVGWKGWFSNLAPCRLAHLAAPGVNTYSPLRVNAYGTLSGKRRHLHFFDVVLTWYWACRHIHGNSSCCWDFGADEGCSSSAVWRCA